MKGFLVHGVAAAIGLAIGCGSDVFACQNDGQCGGTGDEGICQPTGGCSFPDDSCESGQRYGDLNPSGLAGECVEFDGTTSSTSTDPSVTGPQESSTTSTTNPVATTTDASTSTTTGFGTSTGSTTDASTSQGTSTGEGLDPDLLIWLPFEVLSPQGTPDASGNGFGAGCAAGLCPTQVPGVIGMAAEFDGTTECLDIPHDSSLDVDSGFTFAGWIRFDQLAGGQSSRIPFAKAFGAGIDNSWQIIFNQDFGGAPGWEVAAGFTSVTSNFIFASVAFDAGEWVHVAGAWQAEEGFLFVDGVQEATGNTVPVVFDDHGITIGCDNNSGTPARHFDGAVDDFRFYTRRLSDAEIAELASGG